VPFDYDLLVLGAGPAGEKGAVQAAQFGKKVAVIERADAPGGAAVHTGTLPSKTLRETAMYLSGYRNRELYGLDVELNRERAVPKLLARKDAVRELEVARFRWNLERHGVRVVRGLARFVDAHTVEVLCPSGAPFTMTADNVLVATGSKPFRPPHVPFDDEDVDDSDTVLLLDRLPRSIAVLGAGVIGCEYASMFAALRVAVTLVEPRPRLLPFLDFEIGERLRQGMHALGVHTRLGEVVTRVERTARTAEGGLEVAYENGETQRVDKVLVASGRSGRTDELNLAAVGIETDKRGYIKVDERYRTAAPNVYAAGDVIGFPALASTSMEQARVAVCEAFGIDAHRAVSDVLPYGIYTIPEVSCVGLSEEEAKTKGVEYVVGRAFYRENARGKIVGDREGLVKLLFDRGSKKLVGCHCIGERATELVHIGQAMLVLGGTIDTLVEFVFNYPTLSETFKYAAYDALAALTRGNG
jgi:NAD(P) transhydrogenase